MCKKTIVNLELCDSDDVKLLYKVAKSQLNSRNEFVLHVYEPLDRIKRFKCEDFKDVLELMIERYIEPFIERGEPVFVELLRVVEE